MNTHFSLPELYFLLDPKNCEGEKLFRLTLYSLIARDVLAVKVETKEISKFDKIDAKFTLIVKGRNFEGYQPKGYEQILIANVERSEEQARFFTAKCFYEYGSWDNYKDQCFYNPMKEQRLAKEAGFFDNLFSTDAMLTEVGREKKAKLESIVTIANECFETLCCLGQELADIYILKMAPVFLLSNEVSDKDLFEQYVTKCIADCSVEQKDKLKINLAKVQEDWESISLDLKFKVSDFEEIFSMNPHFFDEAAIMALLSHTSTFEYKFMKEKE